ncbi:hypothetical protein FRB94_004460 [Tulasnella sp. JGI-2019a]|nr:hypothetical protein FRB93_005366 [Tulasnella sp. JGI-2019a]KAG9001864.1 hypothetical protein FRB94_004460 [Tulasnella sp. JGI-2019a]
MNESEKLPVELLVRIFRYASGLGSGYYSDVEGTGHYIQRLHIMARACRRWLEIIKGAPELWAFVTDRDPKKAILALQRSQSHPIGIVLKEIPTNKPVFTAVMDHAHRWIQADVAFGPRDEYAWSRLETISVPILQHLKLEFSSWRSKANSVLDLFREDSSRLTSLALQGVAMRRWNSPIFGSRLSSLKLSSIYTSGPSRADLLRIFHACPKLTHLELAHITLSGRTSGLLGSRAHLPLLQTLLLSPSSVAIDIAEMVETPSCMEYSVSRDPGYPYPIVLSAVTMQIQKPFEACIVSGRSLHIHLDRSMIHISCRSSSSDFDLRLVGFSSYEPVVEWLNTALLIRRPPIPPIPIHIRLEYVGNVGPPPSPSDLLQLPNVRSLNITDVHGCTNRLLAALSATDGSGHWPWPVLLRITVISVGGLSKTLLHMIKERAGAALGPQRRRLMGGIAMLERFVVADDVFTVAEFQAARAVLGAAISKLA